jgi:hypothetical protein
MINFIEETRLFPFQKKALSIKHNIIIYLSPISIDLLLPFCSLLCKISSKGNRNTTGSKKAMLMKSMHQNIHLNTQPSHRKMQTIDRVVCILNVI